MIGFIYFFLLVLILWFFVYSIFKLTWMKRDTRKALYPHELDDDLKAALEKGPQAPSRPELDYLMWDPYNSHFQCHHHKQIVLNQEECGCFYCLRVYNTTEIVDWIDMGDTALCPYCSVDAVLPDIESCPIHNNDFMKMMNEKYFSWG